ncbi:MAG: Rieske 2Fe-2S domain-containing protein [Gammaproteobacteria bacterium]|nr:Rieske 2Fe-2S domain-containing protein [Gammaproteobacteria bacterium]MYG68421.1 Rieske 2Fe-2S domain-containing protein [Gammaproteobacteria bacterium]MYH91903.1 Rieske 2Fe-2S domain-containing protein [Gammaproteobacteria bacterium]
MNTAPGDHRAAAVLYPFPEGWYFIASRERIEKESLFKKTWLGEQVVVWCNGQGDVCVARSVCPHLGSDLGPEAGGRVRNGCLVCPFHGYEYDVTGQCVATPFAPAPGSARLEVFETREILGLVFAWWGHGGRPPQWNLPDAPPTGDDWSDLEFWSARFTGHPQETTENSVDLGHLRYVHGYGGVDQTGSVSVDGSWLKSSFVFRRSQKIAGIVRFEYDVSAVTHVHGLGYSYVEVREHAINMESRLWVLATPVDGELVELTLVSQLRQLRNPKRPIIGMRFLPPRLRTRIMNKIIIRAQGHDVMQDVVIWEQKHYRPRPRLCGSDGEISKYRRYCRQFYPDSQDRELPET